MNSQRETLLNLRRLPGRIGTSDTASLLGFQEHDIAILVSEKLLIPLGKPVSNASKYFAATDILLCSQDRDWLAKATKAVSRHWALKNTKKKVRITSDVSGGGQLAS